MRRPIALLVLAAAYGCESPLEPTEIPNIDGDWTFTESWANEPLGISCESAGSISVQQEGSVFLGSYSQEGICTDRSGATFANSAEGNIRAGQISAQTAGFTAANCHYRGDISGSPADRLSGPVRCTLGQVGALVNFVGTWEAGR